MTTIALILFDVVAIGVLAGAVYFPRHRRRDMLLSYVGLNVGVLAVTLALTSSTIGLGLGLGLFGVLSIIRLRSAELSQAEVAYYFVSLAIGLLAGLHFEPIWAGPLLIALIVGVVWVADHPGLLAGYRHHVMRLDSAFTDERALIDHLETLLGAQVRHVAVLEVDLVNDTTRVDVRYRVRADDRVIVAHQRRDATGPELVPVGVGR